MWFGFNAPLFAASILNATFKSVFAGNSFDRAPNRTCMRIQASLGPDVVQFNQGAEFRAAATNAWSLFNTEDLPTCIVFPRKSADVQVAMSAIFQDKIPYAVQAGGHSAMTGWNTVQNGILFFFSHMTNVSYDATKDSITLQPGIHWGDALTALEPFGVAPMGGRLGDVGTGLLLGGGLSYLSGQYGFSSDAYRELDVVLVTGQLVTATANNSYSDLFRALKGGVNRFGIVTRYEVDAIHTGRNTDKNWFGGLILYPNSSAPALIQATERYVRTINEPKAAILMAFSNVVNGTDVVPTHILTLFYRGTELPSSIFGDFLAIPSMLSQIGPVSYVEANNVLGPGADRGFGQLFGASVFSGSGGIQQYQDAFALWSQMTQTIKGSLFGTVLAFTPIQKSQILAGRAKGGNIIDPPLTNYAAVQVQTQMTAGLTSLPGFVENARQILLQRLPRSPGLPIYVNECAANQNAFATYGRYTEMRRTYAKYDPTRFNVRYTQGPFGL